ncbi:MAG: Metalloprotease TldD [Firmicutes bacterium]|nr:Metalloprotease TldD [candidate division NPL-UPA2 bacterium]
MQDLLQIAIREAERLGADYADVRYMERKSEPVSMKNGAVVSLALQEEQGFGIRVMHGGAWGFASRSVTTEAELKHAAAEAVAVARASAKVRASETSFAPLDAAQGVYRTKVQRDPFEIPLEDKLEFLIDIDRELRADAAIRIAETSLLSLCERKWFLSSEGSDIEQTIYETGASIAATAAGNGDRQRRSFSNYAQAGYEFVEGLNLKALSTGLATEAKQLLTAEPCPVLDTTLILGSSQLALQIHESCGHPIELDRVLGSEASFAGTSFLAPGMEGNYPYGSTEVTIVADATMRGGLGTFGYDDEGVPAQCTTIVDKGKFTNFLTSRETAPALGQASNGTMRADGATNLPLIRMTNINLNPGDWTLDEIIKDTKHGIFMESPKSWSLDDKRLNFHFSTEYAYEVRNGAITRLLKNPAYTDMTTHFWPACDAIAGKGRGEWQLWGLPSCAKGEPMQIAHVAHGAAPARFRDVRVGVGK